MVISGKGIFSIGREGSIKNRWWGNILMAIPLINIKQKKEKEKRIQWVCRIVFFSHSPLPDGGNGNRKKKKKKLCYKNKIMKNS